MIEGDLRRCRLQTQRPARLGDAVLRLAQYVNIAQPVLRPVDVKGFVVLPKRRIVERTFAWISKFRMDQQVSPKPERLRTKHRLKQSHHLHLHDRKNAEITRKT
jgi:transposase